MTFQPLMPPVLLLVIAVVLVAVRLITLRGALRRDGSGPDWAVLLRWCGLTLTALLLVAAAARPGFAASGQRSGATESAGANYNVFFVVDRSVNTRVEDYGNGMTRIAGMREDVSALINQYPQARFGLITFTSRPSVDWPLSDDVWSLKPVIASMSPNLSEGADSTYQVNATAARNVLRYQLITAAQQYPHSTNLVFYLGSGGGGSRAPQGEFDLDTSTVDGGAVLGYGSPAGGSSTDSPINEPALRRIAEQLTVPYAHREGGRPVTAAVAATGDGRAGHVASAGGNGSELYWVLTLLAAGLALIEIGLSVRDFRRDRIAHKDVAL